MNTRGGQIKKVVMLCLFLGFAAVSRAALVDDFESYTLGNLGSVANPPWTSVLNPTSGNVLIGEELNGNNYFGYFAPNSANVRGGSRPLLSAIDNTSTASTFFLRFYTETATFNQSFGLSANAAPTAFTDMNVMMRVNAGLFDVRDGAGFTTGVAIVPNTWYNVWAVVDQTQDTFDVYLTSGSANATVADRVADNAAFRVGTSSSLVSFVALVQGFTGAPAENKVRLDDLYQFDGEVLLSPVPEPTTVAMMVLGLGCLFLRKRK